MYALCYMYGLLLLLLRPTSVEHDDMMKTLYVLLAFGEGNPPFTGGFPSSSANNAELKYCC